MLRHGILLEGDKDYTIVQMENGAKRLIYPNKDLVHYDKTKVTIKGKFSKVVNKVDFPAPPYKVVIEENGQVVEDFTDTKCHDKTATFIVKVAPGGVAVVDIFAQ